MTMMVCKKHDAESWSQRGVFHFKCAAQKAQEKTKPDGGRCLLCQLDALRAEVAGLKRPLWICELCGAMFKGPIDASEGVRRCASCVNGEVYKQRAKALQTERDEWHRQSARFANRLSDALERIDEIKNQNEVTINRLKFQIGTLQADISFWKEAFRKLEKCVKGLIQRAFGELRQARNDVGKKVAEAEVRN